ncbi:MAG: DMT family transporter, partial [Nitrososphaerales archaeon]
SAAILIRFIPLDSASIAFWRLFIASAALLIGVKILRLKLVTDKKSLSTIFLLGALLATHFILFIAAVKETTILNATVLVNTSPIQAVIVSTLLYRTKPNLKQNLGLAAAFAGIVIIALADLSQFKQGSILGDTLATLAATSEAFYLNIGRRLRREKQPTLTMLQIFSAAALFSALFIVVGGKSPHLPTEWRIILPLLGLGLIPTALGHTLYFSSLLNLKSFETATLALIEPIGATSLGIVVFFELPTPIFGFAAALVLLGVAFVIHYGR